MLNGERSARICSKRERLIGRGRSARVYSIGNGEVEKAFDPGTLVRLVNFCTFGKHPHPLSTEEGIWSAYYKRVLSKTAAELYRSDTGIPVYVTPALQRTWDGFTMPFVDGNEIGCGDRKAREILDPFQNYMQEVGLHTWSFSRHNPKWHTNVREKGGVHILDMESSIPTVEHGKFGYDPVDYELLDSWLEERRTDIGTLGKGQYESMKAYSALLKEIEQTVHYDPTILSRFVECVSRDELERELSAMRSKGLIGEDEYRDAVGFLEGDIYPYVERNLCVHAGITLATLPIYIPGISVLTRVAWTVLNNLYNRMVGEHDKVRVHRAGVAMLSMIPCGPLVCFGPGSILPYSTAMAERSTATTHALLRNLYREARGERKGDELEDYLAELGQGRLRHAFRVADWLAHTKPVELADELFLGSARELKNQLLGYAVEFEG
jgi:hypothetical protein